MLDVANTSPHRLLLVDPCSDCLALQSRLSDAGWAVFTATLGQLGQPPCDLGMLRLQAAHLANLGRLKHQLSQTGIQWVVAIPPDLLERPGVAQFVAEWFLDYHTLPFDNSRIHIALGRACGMARLRRRYQQQAWPSEELFLGTSDKARALRNLVMRIAPTDSPVMIRGESGSGKELVARGLHAGSRRKHGPFIAVNCGAIPEHLIQSELFGHERGAFTGAHQRKVGRIESAHGGTLFLDEIGDLPLELQANLLRFLQEMQIERVGGTSPISVDVRVLAATHVDLEQAISAGQFREDLYYRLNVLEVRTAPLRERQADIVPMASHFAQLYTAETGCRPRNFSSDAIAAMLRHPWPGNARELANRVRRGMVLAEGREIEAADLGLAAAAQPCVDSLQTWVLRAERQALHAAISHYPNNMGQVARQLQISRPTLYRLLHKHQLR